MSEPTYSDVVAAHQAAERAWRARDALAERVRLLGEALTWIADHSNSDGVYDGLIWGDRARAALAAAASPEKPQ